MLGPRAEEVVADAFGTVPEDGYALLGGGPAGGGLLVARGVEQVSSWDIWAPAAATEGVWRRLEASGAVPVGWAVRETLRIEAGSPAFGVDMDDTTIPVEAGAPGQGLRPRQGMLHRTGGDRENPAQGARELASAGVSVRQRGTGNGTAALRGGRYEGEGAGDFGGPVAAVGQAVGLGYVRREIEPPATLRLGSGSGPEVGVEEC